MKKCTRTETVFNKQPKQVLNCQKPDCKESRIAFFDEAVTAAFEDLRRAGLKPNFLFLGNSVLHVATLNAFLLKLSSQGVSPCGVVCDNIDPSRLSQFEKSDIFTVKPSNLILLKRQNDFIFRNRSVFKEALENCFPRFPSQAIKNVRLDRDLNQTFFLLVTNEEYPSLELWEVASAQGFFVQCVLLEEGVGSYVSQKSTHDFFAKKETSKLKREYRLLKERVANPIRYHYRAITDQACDITHFGLLVEKGNILMPDRDYCYWMRKSLEAQGRIKGASNKIFSKHVIIVGTNFDELGAVEIERLLLEKLVKAISQCGFKSYFRPHPRVKDKTRYELLEAEIDTNNQCPLEAVIASAESLPVAIIGLGSSSQLLSNVLWHVPSLTVASLLKEAATEKSSLTPTLAAYINRLQLFDQTFKEWFVPISDNRDLKEKLMSL